jgi:hypothetical protein
LKGYREYVKIAENFDDYYPCRNERRCKLEHILNRFRMFIGMYNRTNFCSFVR